MTIATRPAHPTASAPSSSRKLRRRAVSILGVTGSIGQSTLSVLDHVTRCGEMAIDVIAVTAHTNVDALIDSARRTGARFAAIADPAKYTALKRGLGGTGTECGAGEESLIHAASLEADWVMAAIVGIAGLAPTLAAARRGADIALANKECLVSAGPLLLETVKKGCGRLLPVDSEHNAIFQVFETAAADQIEKLILTASGGPFLKRSLAQLDEITPEEAAAHPNWDMGGKISVDSATMMNKGLELIEAAHLFAMPESGIDILIHPQSIIHSMVSYRDGSTLAQLGNPDMRTPIAHTLAWPNRGSAPSKTLDLAAIGQLNFENPDTDRFPALPLARSAFRAGNWATAALNAANEMAVAGFIERRIAFPDIIPQAERVLEALAGQRMPSLDTLEGIMSVDAAARRLLGEALG